MENGHAGEVSLAQASHVRLWQLHPEALWPGVGV